MSIGSSILGLMGNRDPRQQLLQSITQGMATDPGAPYAGAAAGQGGTTAPAAASGAGVRPAQQFDSPPDLSALYNKLLEYNSKEQNINRGFGLIGSAISQDGNRANTMAAFTGGRPESDQVGVKDMASMIGEINKADVARRQRAAMMAQVPALAKQLGISPEQAAILAQSGELDKLILEANKPNSELRELANGQIALIDKTSGQQRSLFGGVKVNNQIVADPERGSVVMDLNNPTAPGTVVAPPNNRTDDTKEYDRYVLDEKQRGNATPMSFQEWRMTRPPTSTTTLNNNIDMKEESSMAKTVGDYQGKRFVALQEQADNARQMLNQYDILEQALNAGVRTGSFAEAELAARKIGQAIGVVGADDPKVQAAELIQKVGNRMALIMRNPESGMGMPGSVSDKDIEFLKQSQIGLSTSGAGNKLALDVFRRIENRKIQLAQMAEDFYSQNKTMQGFNKVATEFNSANPMFSDLAASMAPMSHEDRLKRAMEKYAPKGN